MSLNRPHTGATPETDPSLIRWIWAVIVGFLIGLFAAFVGSFGFILGGLFATIALYAMPLGDGVWILYTGFALAGAPSLYGALQLGRRLTIDQRGSVGVAQAIIVLYFAGSCLAVAYGAILPT